jgi:hypothetical protein
MAWQAWRAGFRVTEVPITFVERERGASKMSRAIVLEALWRVTWWAMSTVRRRPRPRPVPAVAVLQRSPDTVVPAPTPAPAPPAAAAAAAAATHNARSGGVEATKA